MPSSTVDKMANNIDKKLVYDVFDSFVAAQKSDFCADCSDVKALKTTLSNQNPEKQINDNYDDSSSEASLSLSQLMEDFDQSFAAVDNDPSQTKNEQYVGIQDCAQFRVTTRQQNGVITVQPLPLSSSTPASYYWGQERNDAKNKRTSWTKAFVSGGKLLTHSFDQLQSSIDHFGKSIHNFAAIQSGFNSFSKLSECDGDHFRGKATPDRGDTHSDRADISTRRGSGNRASTSNSSRRTSLGRSKSVEKKRRPTNRGTLSKQDSANQLSRHRSSSLLRRGRSESPNHNRPPSKNFAGKGSNSWHGRTQLTREEQLARRSYRRRLRDSKDRNSTSMRSGFIECARRRSQSQRRARNSSYNSESSSRSRRTRLLGDRRRKGHSSVRCPSNQHLAPPQGQEFCSPVLLVPRQRSSRMTYKINGSKKSRANLSARVHDQERLYSSWPGRAQTTETAELGVDSTCKCAPTELEYNVKIMQAANNEYVLTPIGKKLSHSDHLEREEQATTKTRHNSFDIKPLAEAPESTISKRLSDSKWIGKPGSLPPPSLWTPSENPEPAVRKQSVAFAA